MVDPITLGLVAKPVIEGGIKFLYDQASEVLKRWRERKDKAEEHQGNMSDSEPYSIELPSYFQGQLVDPQIHFDALAKVNEQMRSLRKDLADYVDGIEEVDTSDSNLLDTVDALRQTLEAVLQQHLTFEGEQRPPSGPVVGGHIDVGDVAGYVAAVRAKKINSGTITASVKSGKVESTGQLIGVDVDEIGR